MRKFFLILAVFFKWLSFASETEPPAVMATFAGDPSSKVEECVNAITGHFFISENDLVVHGYEPIPIPRIYLSSSKVFGKGGWEFFPHMTLLFTEGAKNYKVLVRDTSGVQLTFKSLDKKHTTQFYLSEKKERLKGMTNTGGGEIGAKTNLMNMKVLRYKNEGGFKLIKGDGTERWYEEDIVHTSKRGGGRYFLRWEKKPNGNYIHYSYDEQGRLHQIRTTNPSKEKIYAWVKFSYAGENEENREDFTIETSDGRSIAYGYYRHQPKDKAPLFLLHEVKPSDRVGEHLDYKKMAKEDPRIVYRRISPGNHFLEVDYYTAKENDVDGILLKIPSDKDPRIDRVKVVRAPVGREGESKTVKRFFYHVGRVKEEGFTQAGRTDVLDAYLNKTEYLYSRHLRIESIAQYRGGDDLLCRTHFCWEDQSPFEGNLIAKYFMDASGKGYASRVYEYDTEGNVMRETLFGPITGKDHGVHFFNPRGRPKEPCESFSVSYEHSRDKFNLLTKKKWENGRSEEYRYLPGSNLLAAKFLLEQGHICRRVFFEYNEDNVLVKEISDDGKSADVFDLRDLTERKIVYYTLKQEQPALNFPEWIEERCYDRETDSEKLLKRTRLSYTALGQVGQKEIYDASGKYRYSLKFLFDEKGRLVEESDPLGNRKLYAYDDFGNLIREFNEAQELSKEYHYDTANRLVRVEALTRDGVRTTEQFEYNFKGDRTASIDIYGQRTEYAYDPLGRVVEISYPDSEGNRPTKKFTYDLFGRVTSETDLNGNETRCQYNLFGSPTAIYYPDGTKEILHYDAMANLEEKILADGTVEKYAHDALGQLIRKIIVSSDGDLLFKESYSYLGGKLSEKSDSTGLCIKYRYDSAGRKILEEVSGKESSLSKTFTYDLLGRLEKEIDGEGNQKIFFYDELDRITREREEDFYGNLLSEVRYSYDAFGTRCKVEKAIEGSRIAVESSKCDGFGRTIETVDAEGNAAFINYNDYFQNEKGQRALQKKITFPDGTVHFETFDCLKRLAKLEKYDKSAKLLLKEIYTYDAAGNSLRTDYETEEKTFTLEWVYDAKGRVLRQIENGTATHVFAYNPRGFKEKWTKPDDIQILYDYDGLGRLIKMHSSEGSVSYDYHYDAKGNLVKVYDAISKKSTFREYDLFGNPIQEILANGITVQRKYDPFLRKTQLLLPDKSAIQWHYERGYLKEVRRVDPEGKSLYEHRFVKYNLIKKPIEETLIQSCGAQKKSYNLKGRIIEQKTPFSSCDIKNFDPAGNVLAICNAALKSEEHAFDYDGLNQLVQETGSETFDYQYDGLNNRIQKNSQESSYNDRNQMTASSNDEYLYDQNGNLIEQIGQEHFFYRYDALDRLIEIQNGRHRYLFTYDAWHRRLSETHFVKEPEGQDWIEISNSKLFIYDGDDEIGSLSEETKQPLDLRVLSSQQGDLGTAVAIEIGKAVLLPLFDPFGNAYALVDPATKQLLEQSRFTVFGEETLIYHADNKALRPLNPWRYQSKRSLPLNNLLFFGRRFYGPELGRFITPDPLGYGPIPNLYVYSRNNPLSFFDLYGLEDVPRFQPEFVLPYDPNLSGMRPGRDFVVYPINEYMDDDTPLIIPRYEYDGSTFSKVGTKSNPNVRQIFVNGIRTSYNEAQSYASLISSYTNDHQVEFYHSKSWGAAGDLFRSFKERIGYDNYRPMQLRSFINAGFQDNPNLLTIIFCHSEGGILTYDALKGIGERYRQQIQVYSFGSARIIPREFGSVVRNFVHEYDPVPRLGDYIALKKAVFFNSDHVKILSQQQNPYYGPIPFNFELQFLNLKNHSFMNAAYQKELNILLKDLKNDYFHE